MLTTNKKLKTFLELELKLITCSNLFELLHTIIYEYRNVYPYDHLSLILFDPEFEYRRILDGDNIQMTSHPDLIFTENTTAVTNYYGNVPRAFAGSFRKSEHGFMFPYEVENTASCVLVPILIEGKLIGSFNVISKNKGRFVSNTGTEYQSRLCDIFKVCLKQILYIERLKQISLTDVLTGVNNRRYYDQRIHDEITTSKRSEEPLTCLFFDIDHFKMVNDRYGHQTGDIILREVSNIIRLQLRMGDVLARYGGEEFAALLINSDASAAYEIADRICDRIAQNPFYINSSEFINVTISIGMATLQDQLLEGNPEEISAELIRQADESLYKAKANGRNCVSYGTRNKKPTEPLNKEPL